MLLTTKGRYAVTAMLDIVMYGNTSPVRLCDISSRQQIDLGYLEQIFVKLKRGGLVVSIKGPGGGYMLNKPSTLICLEEIVEAVGESVKMTKCDGSGACRSDGIRCASHNLWVAFEKNIRTYLRSITLADACSGVAL